jgi:hypothetical protein
LPTRSPASPFRDLETAAKWYETLLGPGNQPMPEVIEWQLERGGGLQVYGAPDAEPARSDRVDTIMINDPDGNSIAFARPKDSALAR